VTWWLKAIIDINTIRRSRTMAKDKVVCPECSGVRCWKKGLVPSRTGPKQRYVCFDCGRTFHLPDKPKKQATVKPKTAPETA